MRIYVDIEGTKHDVGEIVNFVANLDSGCDNCDKGAKDEHITTSSTFITPELKTLSSEGYLIPYDIETGTFDINKVQKFLVNHLNWGLYTPGVSASL